MSRMGGFFRNCCPALLKSHPPQEVEVPPVQEVDLFELALGKGKPRAPKLVVSPAAPDETVDKILEPLDEAARQKALRAFNVQFMKVVNTVKQEIADKMHLKKCSDVFFKTATIEANKELHSQLVANPELVRMREELREGGGKAFDLKMLLEDWRGYIHFSTKKTACGYPLDININTLENILSFFNRLTEFVVYLHKDCTYPSALESAWHREQLNKINKAAAYFRELYVTHHFSYKSKEDHFTSPTISESMWYMQKYPESAVFIWLGATVLHKLGLLYPCETNSYWLSCFSVELLSKLNRDLCRNTKENSQLCASVFGLNVWIYMTVYLHSLSLEDCDASAAEIAELLKSLENVVEASSKSLPCCPKVIKHCAEFADLGLEENMKCFGDWCNKPGFLIQQIKKICENMLRIKVKIPVYEEFTNVDGSNVSNSSNDDVLFI